MTVEFNGPVHVGPEEKPPPRAPLSTVLLSSINTPRIATEAPPGVPEPPPEPAPEAPAEDPATLDSVDRSLQIKSSPYLASVTQQK